VGQKVHPYGFRLGVSKDWKARWINEKNYKEYLLEDLKIRDFLKKNYMAAGVSDIYIERPEPGKVVITIKCARPGVMIGKKGRTQSAEQISSVVRGPLFPTLQSEQWSRLLPYRSSYLFVASCILPFWALTL